MRCYHCNERVPDGTHYTLRLAGVEQPMCCPGCLEVARIISEQGLEQFYDYRTAPNIRPVGSGAKENYLVCDRLEVAARILKTKDDTSIARLRCHVGGMSCAACTWLLNKALRSVAGMQEVSINPVTSEALIDFDTNKAATSDILRAIRRFGFEPRPLSAASSGDFDNQQAADLKRLAVAGLGFAQVMSLSAALYLGAFKAMDLRYETFFVFASLILATPVVLYAGAPIFRAAWRSLLARHIGMDVPVSIAILAALGASIFNAFRGNPTIYFDSATMFVFFLSLGRFLESRARHQTASVQTAIEHLLPVSALRLNKQSTEQIGTIELCAGDHVLVAPGERCPGDGLLVSATATLDEALLTGEPQGQLKIRGASILAGSLNTGSSPIELEILRVGDDAYVGQVSQLLTCAAARKPEFISNAEQWASWLAAGLLVATAIVGIVWITIDPTRSFSVMLSMLVVTCPCALSLAAPTAFTVGLTALAQRGLLLRSARVIEQIANVTTWLFDKTGTVTTGQMRASICTHRPDRSVADCLDIAAALEMGIEHPIARALRADRDVSPAANVEFITGSGVCGEVDGIAYKLGNARFSGFDHGEDAPGARVYLADSQGIVAAINVVDSLHPHARAVVAKLQTDGNHVALVSGDTQHNVAATARALGIEHYVATQRPQDKLHYLSIQQRAGAIVAAVGDGINDAPLLAQADVSIAMLNGSELARSSADVVFTGNDLRNIAELPDLCAKIRRTVRRNITWAISYNLAAVPMAAAGFVPPWLAAIGMSASSLIVVLSSLRLRKSLRSDATEGQKISADLALPLEIGAS